MHDRQLSWLRCLTGRQAVAIPGMLLPRRHDCALHAKGMAMQCLYKALDASCSLAWHLLPRCIPGLASIRKFRQRHRLNQYVCRTLEYLSSSKSAAW